MIYKAVEVIWIFGADRWTGIKGILWGPCGPQNGLLQTLTLHFCASRLLSVASFFVASFFVASSFVASFCVTLHWYCSSISIPIVAYHAISSMPVVVRQMKMYKQTKKQTNRQACKQANKQTSKRASQINSRNLVVCQSKSRPPWETASVMATHNGNGWLASVHPSVIPTAT